MLECVLKMQENGKPGSVDSDQFRSSPTWGYNIGQGLLVLIFKAIMVHVLQTKYFDDSTFSFFIYMYK